MAKVNTQHSVCSEKTSENLSNGFVHQNGHDDSFFSHSSKRRKLHKPKSLPKCNSENVEKILKSNNFENGNSSISSHEKTIVKPCRRSERKTMPSSLWDNAVINPFFERKRRKLSDSPTKSKAKQYMDSITRHDSDHKIIDKKDIPFSQEPCQSLKDNTQIFDNIDEGVVSGLDNQGHVRLRRSSRKHSSSVSSISDSKYTLKQEHLLKISESSLMDIIIDVDDCEPAKLDTHTEKLTIDELNLTDQNDGLSENCVHLSDDGMSPIKKELFEQNEECVSKTFSEKNSTGLTESKLYLSPKNTITEQSNTPCSIQNIRSKDKKCIPEHKEKFYPKLDQLDDPITTPVKNQDPVKKIEHEFKSCDNEIDVKILLQDSHTSMIDNQKEMFVDALGRCRWRRKRKALLQDAELSIKEGENSQKLMIDESSTQSEVQVKTASSEITVCKEALSTKEAISLIDGSSFQRFYKMRTRQQNSSAEEIKEGDVKKEDSGKQRRTSRSNSGNSTKPTDQNCTQTDNVVSSSTISNVSSNFSEVRKRTKRVKPDILCSFCLQTEEERREQMISCFLCGASGHPSCLQFNAALTDRVKLYDWECIECKKCELCRKPGDDATLLFCDDCDKGFHMGCLSLTGEPDGHWSCLYCVEDSTYWVNKIRTTVEDKQPKKKKSDKISKRKQLLDDLAMFHEAQSRAQAVMAEERKNLPKLKAPKKKADGKAPPTIKTIEFGCFEVTTWYTSPYPAEYALQSKLYICEFCLKYMKSGVIATRHTAKCPARCPPGDEIYRKDTISVFEVDGRKNKTYCQNLCLLAKLFLDHKTLYYDVEPFLFYILTEYDKKGCHIVGYFSKEKNSFLSYNVSCILVLPPYMKKGYGKMLIDFSYALSKREGKLGSPEKPLSDLGLISYRNYWKEKLLEYFLTYKDSEITIKGISQTLGFNPYDIVSTLQAYGMIKYHKSNHYVLKRPEMLSAFKRKQNAHAGLPSRAIDMSCLKWTPHSQRKQTT